jgi:hypothetical protein
MNEELDKNNLDKVYAEAGQWLRTVNTIGWSMANIFIPIAFTGVGLAMQYPRVRWIFCFSSIFIFGFWVAVSFIYRRTSISAREVLIDIESRWALDKSVSLYEKQKHMKGWLSGVALLQLISFLLLIILWALIFWFDARN